MLEFWFSKFPRITERIPCAASVVDQMYDAISEDVARWRFSSSSSTIAARACFTDVVVLRGPGALSSDCAAFKLDDGHAELVVLYRSGASKAELARRFKINGTTVRSHLRCREVEHRPRRKLHGELLERAEQLYADGWSLGAIGTELEVSRKTVRAGLEPGGVDIAR